MSGGSQCRARQEVNYEMDCARSSELQFALVLSVSAINSNSKAELAINSGGWGESHSTLTNDENVRAEIDNAGRLLVEDEHSVRAPAPCLVSILRAKV